MKTLTAMTAVLILGLAGPVAAQAPAQGAPATDTPVLAGATVAPDCGNLYAMAGRAFCVSAPLASVGALAEAYIEHFKGAGWLPATGEANRVVLVRRRGAGGCDGLQMVAFYDTSRPAGPEALGYLGFATIPGNVCTTPAPVAQ